MFRFLALSVVVIAILGEARAQNSGAMAVGMESKHDFRGAILNDGWMFTPEIRFDFESNRGLSSSLTMRGHLGLENRGGDSLEATYLRSNNFGRYLGMLGLTRYEREGGFADTTEVFARIYPYGDRETYIVAWWDFDRVDGLYLRATKTTRLYEESGANKRPLIIKLFTSLGFSDSNYAGAYYGASDAGIADLTVHLRADMSLGNAMLFPYIKTTALVDGDYSSGNGKRTNLTFGVSYRAFF